MPETPKSSKRRLSGSQSEDNDDEKDEEGPISKLKKMRWKSAETESDGVLGFRAEDETVGAAVVENVAGIANVAHVGISFLGRDAAVIVGIDWYNGLEGYGDPNASRLALAFQVGKIQLMRHELDEEPILLELQMTITSMNWSSDGEILGVVGSDVSTSTKAPTSIVQLFSHNGIHLRTL